MGEGAGAGANINIPLPRRLRRGAYLAAFEQRRRAGARALRPAARLRRVGPRRERVRSARAHAAAERRLPHAHRCAARRAARDLRRPARRAATRAATRAVYVPYCGRRSSRACSGSSLAWSTRSSRISRRASACAGAAARARGRRGRSCAARPASRERDGRGVEHKEHTYARFVDCRCARIPTHQRLRPHRRPAAGDRRARCQHRGGRALHDTARRDRHRQDVHHGAT